MSTDRSVLKSLAFGVATVIVTPSLASFFVRARVLGRDRALAGSTQALAIVPGVLGQYLRRAFLARTLARCHPSATIEFGTIFSKAGAIIDEQVYVGPRCHLGLVHLERDVLLAAGVHVPSGARTHGTDDPSVPMREQQGTLTMVRIGAGAWIGSAAVVMADVGAQLDRRRRIGGHGASARSGDGGRCPGARAAQPCAAGGRRWGRRDERLACRRLAADFGGRRGRRDDRRCGLDRAPLRAVSRRVPGAGSPGDRRAAGNVPAPLRPRRSRGRGPAGWHHVVARQPMGPVRSAAAGARAGDGRRAPGARRLVLLRAALVRRRRLRSLPDVGSRGAPAA